MSAVVRTSVSSHHCCVVPRRQVCVICQDELGTAAPPPLPAPQHRVVRLPCGHQLCHGCAIQLESKASAVAGTALCPLCKKGFAVDQLEAANGDLAEVPSLMTPAELERRCRTHFLYMALQGAHPHQPPLEVHSVPPIIHPLCASRTLYNTAALKGTKVGRSRSAQCSGGEGGTEADGAPSSCSPTTATLLPLTGLLIHSDLNPGLLRANVDSWPPSKIIAWITACDPSVLKDPRMKTAAAQKRWLLEAVDLLQMGESHCHMFVAALLATGGTLIMCCPHGIQVGWRPAPPERAISRGGVEWKAHPVLVAHRLVTSISSQRSRFAMLLTSYVACTPGRGLSSMMIPAAQAPSWKAITLVRHVHFGAIAAGASRHGRKQPPNQSLSRFRSSRTDTYIILHTSITAKACRLRALPGQRCNASLARRVQHDSTGTH